MDFVVESTSESSYIDSLLIALFYKSSTCIDPILYNDPFNPEIVYLQELIKHKFVEFIRKGISVHMATISEIKICSQWCGYNYKNHDTKPLADYYDFLLRSTNANMIEQNGRLWPYIEVDITDKSLVPLNVKKLIEHININNVPHFIAVKINKKTRDTLVDIQKKIKLYPKNPSINVYDLRWSIHAIVCHDAVEHYTVLLNGDNKWLLFSNKNIPCLSEFDIKSNASQIKRDAILIIYCLDYASY